jgi:hypothetical protein
VGNSITVVLNVYRRVEQLERQIDAINKQTVNVTKILVWQNKGQVIPEHLKEKITIADCNENLGVWARFAFALNANTEYVCVFDDDTIPGIRWFENCLKTMKTNQGLLGTRGVRYLSSKRSDLYDDFGWCRPNEKAIEVDVVGHSWFFKREWLSTFWRELPLLKSSRIVGEDMHFSFTLQKYLKLKTYVPPHPINNREMWGSCDPNNALKVGSDDNSISQNSNSLSSFNEALRYYVKQGFVLHNFNKNLPQKKIVIGSGLRSSTRLREILEKYPAIFRLGKFIQNKLKKYNIYI